MLQRFVTFGVWALVGGSAMLLALRLLPTPLTAPPGVQALAPEAPPPASLTRLFGQAAAEAPAPVAAPTSARAPSSRDEWRLSIANQLASLATRLAYVQETLLSEVQDIQQEVSDLADEVYGEYHHQGPDGGDGKEEDGE